ncbi:hypothetical protein [Plantactinospora sp. CA-290183]|uniref:hypothetical protein n=1 Tax=Plantactinospora sp. CA-290183 TaxID=3240006 RepID=UPI003D8B6DEE
MSPSDVDALAEPVGVDRPAEPAGLVEVPAGLVEVPAGLVEVPAGLVEVPAGLVEVPQPPYVTVEDVRFAVRAVVTHAPAGAICRHDRRVHPCRLHRWGRRVLDRYGVPAPRIDELIASGDPEAGPAPTGAGATVTTGHWPITPASAAVFGGGGRVSGAIA